MKPRLLALLALTLASSHGAIPAPAIGSAETDITRFGAVADGRTLCTVAIQKAIDATAAKGGGRVTVPKGRFLSGPIVLASKIDLHLADGAVLLMSDSTDQFPAEKNNRPPFVSASGGHDIRLSGKGVIDGQGESWWKAFRLEKSGAAEKGPRRPQLIAIKDCERVEIEGITTLNPPNTHYSIKQCGDLVIRDIKATAPDDSPNTDALNLNSVRNVLVTGSEISTGDDNIVLLCGAASKAGGPEVENVTIRDCKLGFGHGLSIGSYTSGGVKNVTAENITFDGTTSGIRMKAWRDRGGVVEGIRYRNITMKNVSYPIFISSYYPKEPAGPATDLPANGSAKNPVWKDIEIADTTITGSKNSIILWGLPDQPIDGISLKNVAATAKAGALVFHAKNISFSNVRITPAEGPELQTFEAKVTGMKATAIAGDKVKFK